MNRTGLTRSEIMARVRGKRTGPELLVARLLTALNYRYRLHRKDLPGRPDIAFIGRRKAIFVHGCFWHGHACKRGARIPKTNRDYWLRKIGRNQARDAASLQALAQMNWRSLVIWECALADEQKVRQQLSDFLDPNQGPPHAPDRHHRQPLRP
jgi:DNA mismatch endonuclease, patch repair protein